MLWGDKPRSSSMSFSAIVLISATWRAAGVVGLRSHRQVGWVGWEAKSSCGAAVV